MLYWERRLRFDLGLRELARFYVQWMRPSVWADPATTAQLLRPSLNELEDWVRKDRLDITPFAIEAYLRKAIDDEREWRAALSKNDLRLWRG